MHYIRIYLLGTLVYTMRHRYRHCHNIIQYVNIMLIPNCSIDSHILVSHNQNNILIDTLHLYTY